MMTGIKRLAAVFAAFSALVSCVSEAEDPDTVSNAREWTFTASLDGDDSRTLVKEDNKIWWSPSDSIRIFYGSQASGKFRSSNDNAVAVTKFTGTFDSAIGGIETGQNPLSFWGVYPYSEESVCDDASVTLRFPTEQEAVEGSFAPGAFPTVAKSDNLGLSFWIVGGGVRFTVERTGIRRAVFRSADGSPVSGVARVSFDDYGLPVVTDVSAPVDSVVVIAPSPGFVPGKAYFATMLPGKHLQGLEIVVKTPTQRGLGTIAKSITVQRAVFGKLDKIDANLEYVNAFPIPEPVDLGLPSGILWASCNLGSESQEDYGEYFAWGETDAKNNYYWSTYKWCNGSSSKLTKYCADPAYGNEGFADYIAALERDDDAASVLLGGDWRMPTYTEWNELLNNCTKVWTTLNGVYGEKFYGTKNGYTDNWIFLPAAGYRDGASLYEAGTYGYYWALSKDASYETDARIFYFYSSSAHMSTDNSRRFGSSVRPVKGSYVPVNEIHLDKAKASLNVGGTLQLKAGFGPANASETLLYWHSSDKNVVVVSGNGAVTAVSAGTAVITVSSADGNASATCEVTVTNRVYVPEAVDLGLSVKWASFNLMASTPEEYGAYYAWGETEPKTNYSWSTYKWCYNGSSSRLTKYCFDASYGNNGFTDDKACLETEDDAAAALLGGKWRMPTAAEWEELTNTNNCSWASTTLNGVAGYKVTSKKSGFTEKSIFFPKTGYMSGRSLSQAGASYYYWSRSLSQTSTRAATVLYNDQTSTDTRYYGNPVRAVYGEWKPVTGISLDKAKLNLTGGPATLNATITPADATEQGIVWYSSDESVATVSQGIVFAISPGSATISAKSADGGLAATCSVTVSSHYYVPEAVDLGLSVKWASFNLMASTPEEYGAYYAWGETEPKADYSWSTYKWCYNGSSSRLTKYCFDASYGNNGFTDGKYILDASDDAAAVHLGDKWRIPTYGEYKELYANCSPSTVTVNGVRGVKYTSRIPGYTEKWIFVPYTGRRNGVAFNYSSGYQNYQTNTLSHRYSYVNWYSNGEANRSVGMAVRPVYGDFVKVNGISIKNKLVTLAVGNGYHIEAEISPANASEPGITWVSSDAAVVSVSDNGGIVGLRVGTATITAKTMDGGYVASCHVNVIENSALKVPEAVDLGLSVKWASFNLGASAPEESGFYYAWGEAQPKTNYNWSTYKYCKGTSTTLTKYCTDAQYGYNGYVDGKTVLEPEDDAATVALGGSWRMPTKAERVELRTKCTWTWTTQNGVNGRLVTGPNGNSIFLPAACSRAGTSLSDAGSFGSYWSSSLDTDYPDRACYVHFDSGNVYLGSSYYRFVGLSVRPVSE